MKIVGTVVDVEIDEVPAGTSKAGKPYDGFTRVAVVFQGDKPTRFDRVELTKTLAPSDYEVGKTYQVDVFQVIDSFNQTSRIRTIALKAPVEVLPADVFKSDVKA